MLVKISKHLEKLSGYSKAVHDQFFPSEKEKEFSDRAFIDPLQEDKFMPVKGLCHKYPRRVLVELTMNCSSYCRFCTRRRKVSDLQTGKIEKSDVDEMINYFKRNPEINEAIFSGGDPLMAPEILIYALEKFSRLPQMKILRVHTRVPIAQPELLSAEILDAFKKITEQAFYVSVHFEHPDEFTPETLAAVKSIRQTGAVMLSQTVFLQGINDSYEILHELFSRLSELGIRPYYIYHCDLVKGVEHFIVPIEKEVEIMTKLRQNLSGIAFPIHLIDSPNGSGKIPVPLNFWQFDKSKFNDFTGTEIATY